MTTEELKPKRKGRGPGKKPALVCTSLRLPKYVMDYFDQNYPDSKQAKMREVLADYINQQTGANHDQQSTSNS